MLEKEPPILLQDVEEVNRNAENVPEMRLSTAIRGGMIQGRKREMRRIYTYGASMVAVAAAAIFITISSIGFHTKGVDETVVQTASTRSITDFELFRPVAERDQGLAAALDQGLVMPINQGVEKDGYRIDVAGAVTDGRKAYVLFGVQNHTDHAINPTVSLLELGGVKTPSFGASEDIVSDSSMIEAGQTKYYVYSTNLLPTVSYQKDAKFSVKIWNIPLEKNETNLDVVFNLDSNRFKDQERSYDTGNTLTVNGQKINVHEVLYTPLNTYVDLEYDKDNNQQIFQLIDPVLIGKSGDTIEKIYYPQTILMDDNQFTLVFKSNQLDQSDTTSLKVAGISALKKDQMKIVVDIKKKQIIEAPNTGLKIVPSDRPAGTGEIQFQQRFEKSQFLTSRFSMILDDRFTDAKGGQHNKSASGMSQIGISKSLIDGTVEENYPYNFGEEALNYPQPLTIEIKRYWNPIMDAQSVELHAKNTAD